MVGGTLPEVVTAVAQAEVPSVASPPAPARERVDRPTTLPYYMRPVQALAADAAGRSRAGWHPA